MRANIFYCFLVWSFESHYLRRDFFRIDLRWIQVDKDKISSRTSCLPSYSKSRYWDKNVDYPHLSILLWCYCGIHSENQSKKWSNSILAGEV